ncbi:hypothetical protein FM107_19420 [Sphingobacterium sp. JB170]|nr:hypothetical protein FM107_19420 [Sphingobacterium sp. JB170]
MAIANVQNAKTSRFIKRVFFDIAVPIDKFFGKYAKGTVIIARIRRPPVGHQGLADMSIF